MCDEIGDPISAHRVRCRWQPSNHGQFHRHYTDTCKNKNQKWHREGARERDDFTYHYYYFVYSTHLCSANLCFVRKKQKKKKKTIKFATAQSLAREMNGKVDNSRAASRVWYYIALANMLISFQSNMHAYVMRACFENTWMRMFHANVRVRYLFPLCSLVYCDANRSAISCQSINISNHVEILHRLVFCRWGSDDCIRFVTHFLMSRKMLFWLAAILAIYFFCSCWMFLNGWEMETSQ